MTIYDDYDDNFRALKNRHIPSYRHRQKFSYLEEPETINQNNSNGEGI